MEKLEKDRKRCDLVKKGQKIGYRHRYNRKGHLNKSTKCGEDKKINGIKETRNERKTEARMSHLDEEKVIEGDCLRSKRSLGNGLSRCKEYGTK